MESVLDRIIKNLDLKNDDDFLKELKKIGNVHQPQVSKWRTNGFTKSTEILLLLLLDKIEETKKINNN